MSNTITNAIGVVSAVPTAISNLSNLLSGNYGGATLQLGNVSFTDEELPDHIPTPGTQKIVKHVAPGGGIRTRALGEDYAPIRWKGTFYGSDALARAHTLEAMRGAAAVITLTYLDWNFDVQITNFTPEPYKQNWIEYSIECIVVNNFTVTDVDPGDAADDGVLGGIASAVATVQQGVSIVAATVNQVQSVVAPLAAAAGVSVPALNALQINLNSASALANASGALVSGAASLASVSSSLSSIGTQIQNGVAQTGTLMTSSVASFGTTPEASVAAVSSAADAVGGQAALAQANAFNGLAAANVAQINGAAPTPKTLYAIPVPPVSPTETEYP